jgi:hypothetical protein
MNYRNSHFPVALLYPRGTYRKDVFYYRGADEFLEPEWTDGERRKFGAAYRQARLDFERVKQEYQETLDEYHLSEQYAVQVADYVGPGYDATYNSYRLHQDIAELTEKIELLSAEAKLLNDSSRPTDVSALENEIAAYEAQLKSIEMERNEIQEQFEAARVTLCELMMSDHYPEAIGSEVERNVATQFKNQLAIMLRTLHKAMDTAPSYRDGVRVVTASRPMDGSLSRLIEHRVDLQVELLEVQVQKELTKTHRRFRTRGMVTWIEQMNDIIRLLGLQGRDIRAIKADVGFDLFEKEEEEIRERDRSEKIAAYDGPIADMIRPPKSRKSDRSRSAASSHLPARRRLTKRNFD